MNCHIFHEITNQKTCDHNLTVSREHDLKYNLSNELVKYLNNENVMIMDPLPDIKENDSSTISEHCSPIDINGEHSHLVMTEVCKDVTIKEQSNNDSRFEDVLLEQCQDIQPMEFENLPPLESTEDVSSETLENKLLTKLSNEHIPIKLNVTASYDEIYKLCPVKVRCLQTLKELRKLCEKMGLVLCTADSSINEGALRFDHMIQNCSVEGLYPYEKLGLLCKKYHLKFKNGNSGMVKRKVDLILGHKYKQNGTIFYLVKWKRLTSKRNSWISECYLLPQYVNLVRYYKVVSHLQSGINQEIVKHFYNELVNRKPYDGLTLIKLCALLFNTTESFINELTFSFTELKEKTRAILTLPILKFNKIQSKLLQIMQFSEQRKRVLINLNEWEKDINNFNPATYVEVENHVDLEMAPTSFQFIHDYVRNQEIEEEPICFCECDNCYDNKKSCCPHDSDGVFPYSRYRRLILLPGYPIYECNKRCKCSSDCINRVVQHGQKVRVSIFRTSNGCGWGLKTLEVIQKDQFVLEYLGEIITSEEAEARGELYDFIGRTYLFDLDYGEGNCLYTVDAGHMGNAGHFINHSCDPNLHVFAVWINNPDPNLPRLALFAKRKINRGEELTFDYKMVKNRDGFGVGSSPPVGVQCKCNSKNCRKYLF